MVEVVEKAGEAAWKIRQLDDFERRLEKAALRVAEESEERRTASLAIYEVVLASSGRSRDEVIGMVKRFREAFEDEEEPLTIPRTSGIMNVGPDSWFFDDADLRLMTGRLLGQFQHRVAQYNYIADSEVLKRWADGYDTRLFVRRRIPGTEPVAGVVPGVDLMTLQRLRVAAGGNTMLPTEDARTALEALGYETGADEYEVLARAETLALHLDLPAPVAAALLEGLARDGITDFPEPPAPASGIEEASEKGEAGAQPSGVDRADRRAAAEDPVRGDEPTRVQDPQAKDAPSVAEEDGPAERPTPPRTGREDEPGTTSR
jgi:hypothetical protein